MNDWLCDLQYTQLDPQHPLWIGGFMEGPDGKAGSRRPQVSSAPMPRPGRGLPGRPNQATWHAIRAYREALERCSAIPDDPAIHRGQHAALRRLVSARLLGGFHASHQDGNLRIDYTQHAVCALVQYLGTVGSSPWSVVRCQSLGLGVTDELTVPLLGGRNAAAAVYCLLPDAAPLIGATSREPIAFHEPAIVHLRRARAAAA